MKKIIASLLLVSCSLMADPVFDHSTIKISETIKQAALESDLAYDIVSRLTTEVGPRMAGTAKDAEAVTWASNELKRLGFDKVWVEPANFPAWLRYHESAKIILPSQQAIHITALGNSVSTPKEGVQAEVVMFDTLSQLESAPQEQVKGKIAFINYRMDRSIDGNSYGPAVQARNRGAVVASSKGAVAFMMRSVSTAKHRFAHTGGNHYKEGIKPIAAVALANPDADQIERLLALKHRVEVSINVQTESLGTGTSYNVIGEITGTEFPEQYVLLGAHLDSWDLGTGALDDGAGVAIVSAAAKLIAQTHKPKRSIRVVLFAAEEQGLWGAKAYAANHQQSLNKIVAAAESDFGAGLIYEFESRVNDASTSLSEAIAKQLASLNITYNNNNNAFGGPDLIPLKPAQVPIFSLHQDGSDYFDYHHTADDTLDKIDPVKLKQNVASYAVFAFLAAEANTPAQGK